MAVVRVKRHCDVEPIDALLLACKKRKTDDDDHLASVFKFAATVTDQEENVSKHISKVVGSQGVKSSYKAPNISNITEKLRAENKLFSQNNRLKVVNCYRALNEAGSLEEGESSLTIVDIESLPATEASTTSTLAVDPVTDTQQYVYDIYYAPDCMFDDKLMDNPISCHVLDEMVFEDYANDTNDVEESDDSNDENNWRNDYPEDDPDSIGEDDMKLACQIGGLNISETNSLSSDVGEEDMVYGADDPDFADHDGAYFSYDYDYATYKKRVTKDLDSDASENSDFFDCDGDSESNRS